MWKRPGHRAKTVASIRRVCRTSSFRKKMSKAREGHAQGAFFKPGHVPWCKGMHSKKGWTHKRRPAVPRGPTAPCDICGGKEQRRGWSLSRDHDHITGKRRGLLCTVCNRNLGK